MNLLKVAPVFSILWGFSTGSVTPGAYMLEELQSPLGRMGNKGLMDEVVKG